jgi:hypothetical protein
VLCREYKQKKPKITHGFEVSEMENSISQTLQRYAKTTAPTDSHMLSHCSTNVALAGLTLEIERDPVLSGRYGRSWEKSNLGIHKGAAVKDRRLATF